MVSDEILSLLQEIETLDETIAGLDRCREIMRARRGRVAPTVRIATMELVETKIIVQANIDRIHAREVRA